MRGNDCRHAVRSGPNAFASLSSIPALILFAGVSLAAGAAPAPRAVELKLPAAVVFDDSVGADSAVVFDHATHVAATGNTCTPCHPRPFAMLHPTRRASHREMNAGGSCGSCHDGKQGFGVTDAGSCATCHAGKERAALATAAAAAGANAPAARKLPSPIRYAHSDASPGPVTFRHESHASGGCASCHPKLFAMKRAGARPAGAMHELAACGACHDGAKAFGVEDAEKCSRCHAQGKGTP